METLSLYNELNGMGVNFYHWDLGGETEAVTIETGGRYGVFMDFSVIETDAQERVGVAHEGGHIATGSTHKVSSPYDLIEKHEIRADKWAIRKLVPKKELHEAVSNGHTEIWDLAEYFGVTEDFMRKAVCWYRRGNLDVGNM